MGSTKGSLPYATAWFGKDHNTPNFQASQDFLAWLPLLNKTDFDERSYWQVIIEKEGENFRLNTKRGHDNVDLTLYLLKSPPDGSWQ